jgi:AcrR family transcriptional regulator
VGNSRSKDAGGGMAERITEVALECFCAHGFEGTSMRDLASKLEVTPAALYYHYRSKDEILEATVDPLLCDLETLLAETDAEPVTGEAQQRERLQRLLEIVLDRPTILRLLDGDVGVASHDRVRNRVGELSARLPELLVAPDASTDERIRASAAVGALMRPISGLADDELAAHADELLQAAERALGLARRRRRPAPTDSTG